MRHRTRSSRWRWSGWRSAPSTCSMPSGARTPVRLRQPSWPPRPPISRRSEYSAPTCSPPTCSAGHRCTPNSRGHGRGFPRFPPEQLTARAPVGSTADSTVGWRDWAAAEVLSRCGLPALLPAPHRDRPGRR
ncbi:hypothetical protein GXW82_16175 [Streptacidiphilus sp. 4-A2]|nr:hypothetical protein [Streptacidiphilus sp. 4-A2]